MRVPVTLFRVLNSQINYEKHIYWLMKTRRFEFVKPSNQWGMSSQAAFIAGMEYAQDIMKHRNTYDGLPDVDKPPLSHDRKNLVNLHYRLKAVDKLVEPLLDNGIINNVIN
jgi:hypothetical protein